MIPVSFWPQGVGRGGVGRGGGADEGAVFYDRIHSPVILVEFDSECPVERRESAFTDI
jgi:hypothetical protein